MKKAFFEIDKVCLFLSPNKTMLGKDVVQKLGEDVTILGGQKPLVVTDPGVVKAGLVEEVEKPLVSKGIEVGVFDKVELEPPARIIDECVQMISEGGYDLIIGLGGGSTLDVAKGASVVAANGGKVLDYVGIDTVPKRGLPKILIPTTAGTGSEATRVFVMTDEAENAKKVVYSNFLLADVAVLDPTLTLSMPPLVTADTGLDALVHAIETYVSVNSTPFAEILGIEAISLIAQNLPIAYSKGGNMLSRYNMLLAANLAGAAFTSGGLGAVHGLAYVLGTEYHMSHGRSNAIMLPHVMSFNMTGNLQKFSNIAHAMGENVEGLSLYDAAEKSVNSVKKLLKAVNIPFMLSEYGIPRGDLPKLVKGGINQSRLFAPNPRDLTEKDVQGIYEGAL